MRKLIIGMTCFVGFSLTSQKIDHTNLKSQREENQQREKLNAPSNPDEQLLFAFELVRHGARAPIEDRDMICFLLERANLLLLVCVTDTYLVATIDKDTCRLTNFSLRSTTPVRFTFSRQM